MSVASLQTKSMSDRHYHAKAMCAKVQALDKTAADNGSFLAFNHYPPTKNFWK